MNELCITISLCSTGIVFGLLGVTYALRSINEQLMNIKERMK